MYRVDCEVQGRRLSLRIHPTRLFVPNLMSWFSAAAMPILPGETFADIGTGSGLHAILAAKLGAKRAYGVDISPTAIRFAKENAKRNGVERICRFLRGSLVEPLVRCGIRVDSMIYNAPQFPGIRVDPSLPQRLVNSVNGGPSGGELNARFVREAWKALRPGGRILNPVVSWAGPELTREAIRSCGCRVRELAVAHIPDWGRGNHTRDWLLERPGRHHFRFRYPAGRDTKAWLLELSRDRAIETKSPRNVDVKIRFSVKA